MVEIFVLLVLVRIIGDMARRRERSASVFGVMLCACWFGGEIAGGVLGYLLTAAQPNFLVIYGAAVAGAVCGAGVAFIVAKSSVPLNGEWTDLAELPGRRSRLLGAVVGGVGGGTVGAIVVWFMYGTHPTESSLPVVLQGFLAVGLVGAILGLVSGLQKE